MRIVVARIGRRREMKYHVGKAYKFLQAFRLGEIAADGSHTKVPCALCVLRCANQSANAVAAIFRMQQAHHALGDIAETNDENVLNRTHIDAVYRVENRE